MANLTGEDIFDSVEGELHDLADVPESQRLRWLNWANQFFYRAMSSNDPSRWLQTESYTASGSISTHALPDDLESFAGADQGVYLADSDGLAYGRPLVQVSYGSRGRGYRLDGSNIVLVGLDGSDVVLRYLPVVSTITDLNAETLIPSRFEFWAVSAIKQMYFDSNEDQSGAYAEGSKAMQALKEIYQYFPRTNKFIKPAGSLMAGFTRH